jgi:hypothetical protein
MHGPLLSEAPFVGRGAVGADFDIEPLPWRGSGAWFGRVVRQAIGPPEFDDARAQHRQAFASVTTCRRAVE